MDTSKDYYEAVMRDFKLYARGRSLEQYCRDEAVDYQWLTKAKNLYGEPEPTPKKKTTSKGKTKQPDMIRLHFEDSSPSEPAITQEACASKEEPIQPEMESQGAEWGIASLKITTPAGDEIEIRSSTTSAVAALLAKLAV